MKNRNLKSILLKLPASTLLAGGFAIVILFGAGLLMLPAMHNDGVDVSMVDAFFTSTSAVCVTGLISVDTADTFSPLGRMVVAFLIQFGGLGVSSVGVGLILLARRRIGFKSRLLVKESMNLDSFRGAVMLVRQILLITLCFELAGAVLSYPSFCAMVGPVKAIGVSVFHSIAAFNNAGFDILGGLKNLVEYQNDVLLNLTTCGLIFFGGIGFLVILDMMRKRRFGSLTLHSKVALSTSLALIILGALLLKLTQNISWLGAFFHSVSARTAGFSTYRLGDFTSSGLFVLIMLMFIGASPGSTGGGIKTSTLFTLIQSIRGMIYNRQPSAFHRTLPKDAVSKAFIVTLLSLGVVWAGTFALCILEPQSTFMQILFEVVSAFGTVGLSTGITPDLHSVSKIVLILTMFIGRVGPITVLLVGTNAQEHGVRYSEETISIG